jgi:hypothetical protein
MVTQQGAMQMNPFPMSKFASFKDYLRALKALQSAQAKQS